MRIFLPAVSILALGACMSSEVNTGRGVGFGNYDLYQQQREYMGNARAPQPQAAAAPMTASAPVSSDQIAQNQAQYAAVQPAATPERSGASKSNIAAFALSTSHPIGTQMYRRSSLFGKSGFERACAKFASDSLAQEAFLDAGGPERDRLGVDPDGDGYACRWDPAAFRLARS